MRKLLIKMDFLKLLKDKNAEETGFSVRQIVIFILLIAFLAFMFIFIKGNHDKANSLMDIFRGGLGNR